MTVVNAALWAVITNHADRNGRGRYPVIAVVAVVAVVVVVMIMMIKMMVMMKMVTKVMGWGRGSHHDGDSANNIHVWGGRMVAMVMAVTMTTLVVVVTTVLGVVMTAMVM